MCEHPGRFLIAYCSFPFSVDITKVGNIISLLLPVLSLSCSFTVTIYSSSPSRNKFCYHIVTVVLAQCSGLSLGLLKFMSSNGRMTASEVSVGSIRAEYGRLIEAFSNCSLLSVSQGDLEVRGKVQPKFELTHFAGGSRQICCKGRCPHVR